MVSCLDKLNFCLYYLCCAKMTNHKELRSPFCTLLNGFELFNLPQDSHENQVACDQSAELMDMSDFGGNKIKCQLCTGLFYFLLLFILLFANLYKHLKMVLISR